jgi:hypothetical protein
MRDDAVKDRAGPKQERAARFVYSFGFEPVVFFGNNKFRT